MNREIKFRAYDPSTKQMYMDCLIGDSGKFVAVEYSTNDEELDITYSIFGNGDYPEAFEIMQFTGLKDKNGVDIYFKDIVKAPSGNLFIVDWHEDEMRIALNRLNTWYNFNVGLYEVIGNIYETPELCQ